MKLQFLDTSQPGLRWFRQYYRDNPQLDKQKAFGSFKKARNAIKENPYLGHTFDDFDQVYQYIIRETNFSILYTIKHEVIWVIDIRDARGLRSSHALKRYILELRNAHGLL